MLQKLKALERGFGRDMGRFAVVALLINGGIMEQVQEGSDLTTYGYAIDPRPAALGGGWRLRLLENGEEVGGGVFPPLDTDDAKLALDLAYGEAMALATDWLETRK